MYACNRNWDIDDDLSLVETGLQERRYYCCWVNNGFQCRSVVKGKDFSSHLRDQHGISGPPASQHRCLWAGCQEREFNRDCLIRHLREQHLQWRWPCPTCHQDFTRKNTMLEHRVRCNTRG